MKTTGVEFIEIFVKDTEVAAKSFVDRHRLTFPAGLDRDMKIANAYNFIGTPLTVFITKDGFITERVSGPMREKDFARKVEQLLR